MMKSEKTKRRKSLYLGVLSLVLGGVSCAVGLIALYARPSDVFYIPLDYGMPFWFVLAVLGVLAIITGKLSKSKFKVGVVLGAISAVFCMLLCFGTFYFVTMDLAAKESCHQQTATLSSAIQKYSEQNEGTLPDANAWCDQLLESAKDEDEKAGLYFVLEGHSLLDYHGEKMNRFAFNKNLDSYRLPEIDRPTVLLFETGDFGWNQNGTLAILTSRGHSGFWPLFERGSHFILVGPDSTFTVEFVKDSELKSLNWTLVEEDN